MKRLITVLIVVMALAGGQALALYQVDIGDPSSEAGYNLVGWGPIEPDTHGGGWGGIAPGNCRVIWDASDNDPSASLTLPTPVTTVAVRHLLGIAGDSFDVDVDGLPVGSVSDVPSGSEVWATSAFKFPGSPGKTLGLTATDAKWGSFNTYGQVGIDWAMATEVGETYQEWTFDDDDDPAMPELDMNPYGTPTALIDGPSGAPVPEWLVDSLGRDGVWTGEAGFQIALDIPNQMVDNPYKEIYVEIGFLGDMDGSPSVFPFGGKLVDKIEDIELVGGGWKKFTGWYRIEPNPDKELIFSYFSSGAVVDYMIVNTICIPEPMTICLLGLGGLMLRRRRSA